MKKINFIYLIAIVAITATLFSACKKESVKEPVTPVTPVTGVTLSKDQLTLPPGCEYTIIVTIEPDNASNKNVSWSSDNPNTARAKVDGSGVIVTQVEGKATITVTTEDGNYQATCKIVVDKNAPHPDDYRAKWIGSYECEEKYSIEYYDGSGYDAVYQTTVIVVIMEDNLLMITEKRGNQSYEVEIDKLGHFEIPLNHGFFRGNFIEKDSIKMEKMSGSMGSSSHSIYKGKKNKRI